MLAQALRFVGADAEEGAQHGIGVLAELRRAAYLDRESDSLIADGPIGRRDCGGT